MWGREEEALRLGFPIELGYEDESSCYLEKQGVASVLD